MRRRLEERNSGLGGERGRRGFGILSGEFAGLERLRGLVEHVLSQGWEGLEVRALRILRIGWGERLRRDRREDLGLVVVLVG